MHKLCFFGQDIQSFSLCLAVAEPITAVLTSPLIVDLYSSLLLPESCTRHHILFTCFLFAAITVCSTVVLYVGVHNLDNKPLGVHNLDNKPLGVRNLDNKPLGVRNLDNKPLLTTMGLTSNLNYALVVMTLQNIVSTQIFLFGLFVDETHDNADVKHCTASVRVLMAHSTGLRALIPQSLLCLVLVIFSIFAIYYRTSSQIVDEFPTSTPSGTFFHIFSTLMFQILYYMLRFTFMYCACSWYGLLDTRMAATLNFTCLKSFVISSSSVAVYLFWSSNNKHNIPI